jgi:hypothetical protein
MSISISFRGDSRLIAELRPKPLRAYRWSYIRKHRTGGLRPEAKENHQPGRCFPAVRKIAIVCLKFSVRPGNSGLGAANFAGRSWQA